MIDRNELLAMISGYPYHVLIVDDDPVHLSLEKEILQAPKYVATEASSGADALRLLATLPFDVVLLADNLGSDLFADIAKAQAGG
jgi:CheY-like chemotaxis protein